MGGGDYNNGLALGDLLCAAWVHFAEEDVEIYRKDAKLQVVDPGH
jgi:hypothetical protein